MQTTLPANEQAAGRAIVRRNSLRRRLATRADTPEVIRSFCDGTTLVEFVITDDRNNPEERRTANSPTCTP